MPLVLLGLFCMFVLLLITSVLGAIIVVQQNMLRDLVQRVDSGPDHLALATNTAVEAVTNAVHKQVGQLSHVIDRVIAPAPPQYQEGVGVRQGTEPLVPWYAGADVDLSDPTDAYEPDPGYLRSDGAVIGQEETEPFGIPGLVSADVSDANGTH